MSYDLYRTASIYESSANTVNINPSLALPGYFSERPALIHNIPEKSFEEMPEATYSPVRTENNGESDPFYTVGNTGYTARTHSQLAERVADEIAREKAVSQQPEIKEVILAPVSQKLGKNSLLLAAANL